MEALAADLAPKPGTPLLLFIGVISAAPRQWSNIIYDAAARILDARG